MFSCDARRDAPDHAQIDQRDAPVFGQKDVAGMRVCVENAVDENLFEIGVKELFGQLVAVQYPSSASGLRAVIFLPSM